MRRVLLALIGLLGLLVVGCAGGDDEAGGQATAALSPVATPAGVATELPCEVPDDIKSYRYTMRMKMDVPGLEQALEEAQETAEAAGQEAEDESFAGLFFGGLIDMRVEGAFVAPDRAEALMTFGDLEVTSIIIGDREWTKLGDNDWEESTGEAEGWTPTTDLTDLCEGFTLREVTGLEAREETKNGVDTLHYHLDESDMTPLAELFGDDTEEPGEFDELLEEAAVDLWLAKDGNWPVRMEAEASGEDEEGNDVSVTIFMEVKDLNDPDIKIEPPITSD